MVVGILGLGLIGGSAAKGYKENSDFTVLGADTDKVIVDFALMSGAIDAELKDDNISQCDLLILAVRPKSAEEYLKKVAPLIKREAVVIDFCGTKRNICETCFPVAEEYGFTFVGGHPMAGTHNSGFKYARANMFNNAPMVIVPPVYDEPELLDCIKKLLSPLGFAKYSVTTAEKHDEMIAFTSQMAHVVSNAYVKSPTAKLHKGFSAGSYKDLTRVAWLNPEMWTELFLENKDNLIFELDCFIKHITQYREALKNDDAQALRQLLDDGRKLKAEIDGR